MRQGVDKALTASKDFVTPKIESAMNNLPAGGKYSKGGTKASIDSDHTVSWLGYNAEIKVGFDFSKSGMKSIYLMYGTPRMRPVTGLYNAIYGSGTQRQIAKIQEEELNKVVKSIMEGK